MPGIGRSINVATVRTNFIADTRHFENGIRQAVNLQGQLTGSLAGTTRAQRQQNQTAAAFAQSLRATLVATAAYTVAIDLSPAGDPVHPGRDDPMGPGTDPGRQDGRI